MIPVMMLVAVISLVSTLLFTTAHRHSIERELIARGNTLSYSLSKAAEEGMVKEDLGLIEKAAYITRAEDVELVQICNHLWEPLDAFPFNRLKEPTNPAALNHFSRNVSQFHVTTDGLYDFYSLILFAPYKNAKPVTLGFARVSLSASHMRGELKKAVVANVAVSAFMTLLSMAVIGLLLNRVVVRRVKGLNGDISLFRNGALPPEAPNVPDDEIGEVLSEFYHMGRLVKEKEEELLQARKMEAIGTLAGGIAHDFNNMLQGIIGYTSLIKMKLEENDPLYRPIEVIEHSANNAAELTKRLLGFARGGKYITKSVDLNAAVANVVQIFSRTIDRSIEIRKSLENDLWRIQADQSQLEHVLLNLCINARDAMPGGGLLSVETLNYEGGTPFPEAPAGKYAVLRVSDTGIGMEKTTQRRIFEPFFTTKDKGKGTGMGLAMVYGVVKNHGGFITVDSEVGKGSVFTVYLPADFRPPGAVVKTEEEKVYGKGLVLVVDDEDIVRNFVREALLERGFEVLEASDGREAVDIYRQRRDEIDAVVLDVIMPGMGGKEAFEKMKELNPEVKVLVSSGYSMSDAVEEMLKEGAMDFIEKPFDLKKLVVKVKVTCASA